MNAFVWVVVLLVLGVASGKIVGALTAFTRGPGVYDLLAGGFGAVISGVILRLIGPASFRAPLLTLLSGVGVALLATWLMRIATWAAEAPLRRPDDDPAYPADEQRSRDMMTTSEGTRLLLSQGRLVAAPASLIE